ncbi:enoyl-CoA hydratase-related protein [Acinetobacter venetianus]|uniref:enoyl-CoA hydratase-related protein n=1 Tax=Acinetobacter venetianus TaxID=52133 RepID=UPI0010236190|nr:enoyl-CoA hydratase-related protein [Acinetobacter venetianus]RZG81450.1 enoyl-CoA hydratase [Acinetobacter venetianus]
MQQEDDLNTQITSGTICQIQVGKVLTLTINTPNKKNAINYDMYLALSEALDQAAINDEIHVVLLTGANQIFTSGNDVNAFKNRNTHSSQPPSSVLFLKSLATFPKPIVAKVEGIAIGIGSTMLLHCDLVYACEDTIFQFPFVNLGLVPEAGSSYILPRLVGFSRSSEIILLGEKFSAEQAKEYGFVNSIYSTSKELQQQVDKVLNRLANQPIQALQLSKKLLRNMPIDDILHRIDHESKIFADCLAGDEFKTALDKFQKNKKSGIQFK